MSYIKEVAYDGVTCSQERKKISISDRERKVEESVGLFVFTKEIPVLQ